MGEEGKLTPDCDAAFREHGAEVAEELRRCKEEYKILMRLLS
jgi:hypothetical protein